MKEQSTYIKFVSGPPKPKTLTWWVMTKDDGLTLGIIGWFARWRKYGFYPESATVFEEVCLREIAEFCERKTREHRAKRKVAKRKPRRLCLDIPLTAGGEEE